MASTLPNPIRLSVPTIVCGGLWAAFAALAASVPFAPRFDTSGLQIMVGLLTLFIGAIVATFSLRFMRSDPRRRRYFWLLAALVLAALAFVLSSNVVIFAIGWVASGIILAELIGHPREWDEAASAARRTRRTFLLGDAAVLVSLTVLAWHASTLSLAEMMSAAAGLPPIAQTLIALGLLTGAAARCALPPFSGWLLTSMTAPTPVSALMHAGLVNAGGFLLLRMAPLFEAAPTARFAAVALGLGAALWGVGIMGVRSDIKRSLAGSAVSQMGFMIMSIGLGAYAAALWHMIAHGLFKAWLFLGAGSAVGLRATAPRSAHELQTVAIVAGLALTAAIVIALGGGAGGELVPLVLAGTTAAITLAAALGAPVSAISRLSLFAAVAGLIGPNILGFGLAQSVLGAEGPPLLSARGMIALLLPFLGLWLWQASLIQRRRAMPAALYVRLLNAGSSQPAKPGAPL